MSSKKKPTINKLYQPCAASACELDYIKQVQIIAENPVNMHLARSKQLQKGQEAQLWYITRTRQNGHHSSLRFTRNSCGRRGGRDTLPPLLLPSTTF